jgi:hypothetical protein
MRRRLLNTRVTLETHRYPSSQEFTELDYRTRVTTDRQDDARLFRLISIATLIFIAVGFAVRLLSILPPAWGLWILFLAAVAMLVRSYAKFLQKRPPWLDIGGAFAFLFALFLLWLTSYAPTPEEAYLFVFGPAVLGAAVLSYFVTKQVCCWMTVNERMTRRVVHRWQWCFLYIWSTKTPRPCPEVAAYRRSLAALAVAFGVGYVALDLAAATEWRDYAAIAGVFGFLVALPLLSPGVDLVGLTLPASSVLAGRVTYRSLRTFVCYNRHQVQAAGVFRFPTRLLRTNLARDIAVGCTLGLLTMALVAVSVASPRVLYDRYMNSPSRAGGVSSWFAAGEADGPTLTTSERLFLSQLPPEKRTPYLEAKKAEQTPQRSGSWGEAFGGLWQAAVGFVKTTLFILFLCWLMPSLLLFSILWFTGGRLLAAYYLALEAPDAYEKPRQPTTEQMVDDDRRQVTPWDNRIERIIRSKDELEAEHLYLGTSIEGDYPILLHLKLLQRHAHILGDTGSGKTALGIAPMLTQLIARERSSVLVIDLKGDKALFEAAREEARRSGVPFKWFTNQTDRSSYVFNPFAQSHVGGMTTNQLTQGILQALALDYGEDYGRGYFSALNELVLASYLKQHRADITSFKKLHSYVSDRDAYRRIGNVDDWEKTRHLAGIVDKLAQVTPLNVAKGTPGVHPDALAHQIDLPRMLSERQVVYFYLSSAQEQTTVPKVAKLALFSLLTAAAKRGKHEKNRVYVFVDEFQRVIADNIRIFLEQARSMKLHFILANQTVAQLNIHKTDLTDVVESCTAFKQSFRASDGPSIKRLIETSGEGLYHSLSWTQLLNDSFMESDDEALSVQIAMKQSPDGYAQAKVKEEAGPLLEKNSIIEVSALPLASFVKFTEGSGYTQQSGHWTTVLSEYHITEALFGVREEADWPATSSSTILVSPEEETPPVGGKFIEKKVSIAKPDVPEGFEEEFSRRLGEAAGGMPPPPKQTPPPAPNGTTRKKKRKPHARPMPPQEPTP